MFRERLQVCRRFLLKVLALLFCHLVPRMRRAESVPSDINNRIDQTAEITLQFGTLPKMMNRRVSELDSALVWASQAGPY